MNSVFILGCGRSGTTSMLEALQLSSDTCCALEPFPDLNIESRELMEGRLIDPYLPIREHIIPRIIDGLKLKKIYVEKQISLIPFMEYLSKLLNCRFIILKRDGRDVVRSLINWHNQMFPIIYQECQEKEELSPNAKELLANQVGQDPFDYSLPRPLPGDPWLERWQKLSRFEMVTWYWSRVNCLILEQIEKLDPSRYIIIDYTRPRVTDLRRVYDFVGLKDFKKEAIERLLERKVNSLEERIGVKPAFPKWNMWSVFHKQRFMDIAFDTMKELGYIKDDCRPAPPGWIKNRSDQEYRIGHRPDRGRSLRGPFLTWFESIEQEVGKIDSIIEVGYDLEDSVFTEFNAREHVRISLSSGVDDISSKRRLDPNISFYSGDLIRHKLELTADLVFSHNVIDSVYDIEAFIKSAARMSKKIIYLSSREGYFPNLIDHRHEWNQRTGSFDNAISPQKAESILHEEGFETIAIFPQRSFQEEGNPSTVIVASREKLKSRILMNGHIPHFSYKPYIARSSSFSIKDIMKQINIMCYSYSHTSVNLANNLNYFENIIREIKIKSNIKMGTVHDLALGKSSANLSVRVDVDMDLVTAVEMADIAAVVSFPLSFYLLHTASYYGFFYSDCFHRNEGCSELYLILQNSDAEVGLHIDPLQVYLKEGIDGAAAVQEELRWLRSIGLSIKGTSAHNAAPVYGAENFEIFKGRTIHRERFLFRDYRFVPLAVLDEKDLGLSYEAGDATPTTTCESAEKLENYLRGLPRGDFIRDSNWFRTYVLDNPHCSWGYSYHIWLLGRDMWVVSGMDRNGEKVFWFRVPWTKVSQFLDGLREDEQCIICLHPIYLGKREKSGEWPIGSRKSVALS